jgi:hypothetical protein
VDVEVWMWRCGEVCSYSNSKYKKHQLNSSLRSGWAHTERYGGGLRTSVAGTLERRWGAKGAGCAAVPPFLAVGLGR